MNNTKKSKPWLLYKAKLKDYILDKLFPEGQDQAWEELKAVLMPRIEDAENNPPAKKTFEQLTQEIIQKSKA